MTPTSNFILSVRGLTKKFGGLTAVNNVSLDIEKGSIKTIIGPNGSGKTTFFNLITGALKPTSGTIIFNGKDITRLSMHQRTQNGISRSYQITNIFPHLTAFENIRLAVQAHGRGRLGYFNIFKRAGSITDYHDKVIEIATTVGFDTARLYIPARLLPHAEQRKLEISMALATEPILLLLDEPTAGMAVEEIPEVTESILRVKESYGDKLTIIGVEHKMDVVMRISEEIIVLSSGKMIAKGSPKEVQENEEVLTAYLGGDALE